MGFSLDDLSDEQLIALAIKQNDKHLLYYACLMQACDLAETLSEALGITGHEDCAKDFYGAVADRGHAHQLQMERPTNPDTLRRALQARWN